MQIACLLGLAAVGMNASTLAAALRPPPIEFTLSPHTVQPGQPLTIRIATASGAKSVSDGPLDVYVMWATTDRAAFLRPDGAWSPTPVPLRRAMDSGSPMTVMEWHPQPPGELPLAMVAVPAGADPLVRSDWRFRPVLRSARVATAPHSAPVDVATTAALLAATVVAIAVVAVMPRLRDRPLLRPEASRGPAPESG